MLYSSHNLIHLDLSTKIKAAKHMILNFLSKPNVRQSNLQGLLYSNQHHNKTSNKLKYEKSHIDMLNVSMSSLSYFGH